MEWYPWGEEALTRAREEDKPILLSIGYSACHWCHVMERESFEDVETATLMNEGFVNIKVDREERPDLDGIYMHAVQALTGQGGWPLTAFLTPRGKAFFGGTYFPPTPRQGMPSFRQVLAAVLDAYRNRRYEVERGSDQLLEAVRTMVRGGGGEDGPTAPAQESAPDPGLADKAFHFLRGRFDERNGGFGPPPKFPQPTTMEFLLGHWSRTGEEGALEMVLHTLRAMGRGGMRDHLGGGFHRYSVDGRWLVPHFEKMLYDNGLLARVYLHGFLISGETELRDVATSTLDYILEDLRHPGGGFYSARDADSEGEEGLFYVWTQEEIGQVLGPEEAGVFGEIYGVTPQGNFEGRNILHLPLDLMGAVEGLGVDPQELDRRLTEARGALLEARSGREAPFCDEKILTAWNAFVLRALAEAGGALGRPDYLGAARENADFLLCELVRDGRLLRSWKEGPGSVGGFLEDYAALGNALLTLHEVTLEPRWLTEAKGLSETLVELFWAEEEQTFFDTPRDGEALIVRPRDVLDNATPSGHSLAVELLTRAGRIFGREAWVERARRCLVREAGGMSRFPSAFGRLLAVGSQHLDAPMEVALLGSPQVREMDGFLQAVHSRFMPGRVVVGGHPEELPELPLLQGRGMREGRPTAYLCRDFTCTPPIMEAGELVAALDQGRRAWL